MTELADRFWEQKTLNQMSKTEWEALCDGCGKCCLTKLQDEETNEIVFTDVSCKQLDCATCRCKSYENRLEIVPDCLVLTLDNLPSYAEWLPGSCAYVRLYKNKALPTWHPLLNDGSEFMHKKGHSAAGKIISEDQVPDCDLEDHVVSWAGD